VWPWKETGVPPSRPDDAEDDDDDADGTWKRTASADIGSSAATP